MPEQEEGPTYASLEEDRVSTQAPNVDVQIDETTVPSNDYRYTLKRCGFFSLRQGCMVIAGLYTVYSLVYFGLILSFLIMLDSSYLTTIWNLNMVIFEAYFTVFITVFMCLGIYKFDYRRILISKWIMILYMLMTSVIELRIIVLSHVVLSIVHLVIFLIPVIISIFYVHSYEAELWLVHRSKPGIPTLLKKPPKEYLVNT